MPINGRDVMTGDFLVPRKTSVRQLETGARGARGVRGSPSPWDPAPVCTGLAIWEQQSHGPEGMACQEPQGPGPGVAGS